MGVAQNFESMGRAKGKGGETDCPPDSWMADMELHEGKTWRHNSLKNRHDRGNPPISKIEILAKTAAWRNNWKVARSTEGGSTPYKCMIGGGSSGVIVIVTGWKIFVKVASTAMKTNAAIAGDSATGQKKFTARKWLALIGYCGVEIRKQVKKLEANQKGLWCNGGAHHCGHQIN